MEKHSSTAPSQSGIFQAIGPGLLMAGAAIGVSHIVQSTRAGADYGWQLVWIVILINLFKYPFFEYGHRYAAATGESLLHGYRKMGALYLWVFLVLNVVTAVISLAGVTIVTAVLANHVFGLGWDLTIWSLILIGVSAAIVGIGHYRLLDNSMKIIMVVLVVATAVATAIAVIHGPSAPPNYQSESPWTMAGFGFVIALMGWMPAPIELSVWQSLWIGAKERSSGRRLSMSGVRFDFNLGYGASAVMAVMFVAMGALIMHGTGETFVTTGAGFATQFIQMYAAKLGAWSMPIVGIAAFTTMLSTTITVVDAYPRSLAVGVALLRRPDDVHGRPPYHMIWVALVGGIGLWIIHSFRGELDGLIQLATVIAFLTAPVFAVLNFRLVISNHMPTEQRPSAFFRLFSFLGLVYLVGFGGLYIIWLFLAHT